MPFALTDHLGKGSVWPVQECKPPGTLFGQGLLSWIDAYSVATQHAGVRLQGKKSKGNTHGRQHRGYPPLPEHFLICGLLGVLRTPSHGPGRPAHAAADQALISTCRWNDDRFSRPGRWEGGQGGATDDIRECSQPGRPRGRGTPSDLRLPNDSVGREY
jgi:hypothetical protein